VGVPTGDFGPRDNLSDGCRDIGRDGGEGMERCQWSRWQRAAALVSGGTGGAERAHLGATGGTQEGKFRGNDSKGGKLVYAHMKPGDQNGNPSLDVSRASLSGVSCHHLPGCSGWRPTFLLVSQEELRVENLQPLNASSIRGRLSWPCHRLLVRAALVATALFYADAAVFPCQAILVAPFTTNRPSVTFRTTSPTWSDRR
jgi:hypothetical protein